MTFVRINDCNRCGQCCGADGSPNQASPWPEKWLESHAKWDADVFESVWPYAQFLGIGKAQGKPFLQDDFGSVKFKGGGNPREYFYTWINGRPCKDISVNKDGTSYSLECPLLKGNPGDTVRPCGLVGEKWENFYQQVCFPEGPEQFQTQEQLDQWRADHPLCSHDWVEE